MSGRLTMYSTSWCGGCVRLKPGLAVTPTLVADAAAAPGTPSKPAAGATKY